MFKYATHAVEPCSESLASFYPSPALSNLPQTPTTGSDLLSRRTAGVLGIFVPPAASTAGGSSDDEYGPLSPVYSDLPALIHVAFIVVIPSDGHILSLRLLPTEPLGADVGPSSLGWRLAWPKMAANLVLHLLEVSAFTSAAELPAFKPLLAKLPHYRSEIQDLSPASKINVTILCVLGARATSQSELFGVVGVDLVNPGASSSELASLVGRRREEVCQNLMELALDLCDDHSVAIDACTLESLAALIQLFTVEEAWEGQHRHILYLAHSLYVERLHACTTAFEATALKTQAGVALFEHDCISSSTAKRHCEITQVSDYIETLVQLPSLSAPLSLPYYPDPPHSHPISCADFANSFQAAACWVGGAQRFFTVILDQPHHPNQPDPVFHLIPALWAQGDHVRAAIQRRQRALDDLAEAGADAGAIEGQVLAGMRVDLRLVELLMVAHGFLLGLGGTTREMRALVELSWLRMRKCLKLIAYYANVYLSSTKGRPLLYHLVVQLELLPNWTSLVVQRVGEAGGPREKEYEVSEQELDWLTSAMRVAEFYTPLASQRLEHLLNARRVFSPPLSSSSQLTQAPLKTIQEVVFYPSPSPPLALKPLPHQQQPAFDMSTYLPRSAEHSLVGPGIEDVEGAWEAEVARSYYDGGEFEQPGGEWGGQDVRGFGEGV